MFDQFSKLKDIINESIDNIKLNNTDFINSFSP
jgi:hypothetical protein